MWIEIQDLKGIDVDRNIGFEMDRCGQKYRICKREKDRQRMYSYPSGMDHKPTAHWGKGALWGLWGETFNRN